MNTLSGFKLSSTLINRMNTKAYELVLPSAMIEKSIVKSLNNEEMIIRSLYASDKRQENVVSN